MRAKRAEDLLLPLFRTAEKQILRPLRGHQDDTMGSAAYVLPLPMTGPLRHHLQGSLGAAYTITRELGGGGMSRVFLAEETALGRSVVGWLSLDESTTERTWCLQVDRLQVAAPGSALSGAREADRRAVGQMM